MSIINGNLGIKHSFTIETFDFLKEKAGEISETIAGIAHEVFATLLCIALYPFPRTRWNPKHPDPNKPSILLIHGYGHNSSAWHFISWKLKDYNVFTVNLQFFRAIEENSKVIQQKLREIKELTHQDKIYICGHSMGGLVGVHAATSLGQARDPTIPTIITLGSPLEGTKIAKIGIGHSSREMEPQSPFLIDLKERIEKAVGIRFVHFSSTEDEIILPQESARPQFRPDAEQVIFPHLGHMSYLYSNKVAQEILRVLPLEVA